MPPVCQHKFELVKVGGEGVSSMVRGKKLKTVLDLNV